MNELEEKWHKLLKLLRKKGVIDYDEQDYLELDSFYERKKKEWWNE